MKLRIAVTVLCTALVIQVGCSDGLGLSTEVSVTATETTLTPVTERHPSGRMMASGQVLPGTTTRVGQWTAWFDDESGTKRWEGHYDHGTIDKNKPWREWNPDGSIKADAQDQ
jgi:hypothetical protein